MILPCYFWILQNQEKRNIFTISFAVSLQRTVFLPRNIIYKMQEKCTVYEMRGEIALYEGIMISNMKKNMQADKPMAIKFAKSPSPIKDIAVRFFQKCTDLSETEKRDIK